MVRRCAPRVFELRENGLVIGGYEHALVAGADVCDAETFAETTFIRAQCTEAVRYEQPFRAVFA